MRAGLTLAAIALAACGPSLVAPPCRLGVEHDVGHVTGATLEDVAVVATKGGSIVAWTSTEGTFARALGGDARPRGEPVRIAPFASGGIALAVFPAGDLASRTTSSERIALLVVEQGDESGRFGAARLFTLDARAEAATEPAVLGGAGLYSQGAALAGTRDGWIAAWHDGTPGAFRVRVASVHAASGAVEPRGGRVVTREGRSAWAPTLATSPSSWAASWQETWFDDRGREAGSLRALEGTRVRDLRAIARPEAGPALVWFGGGWVLSYRDNQDGDRHAEYYVGPMRARRVPTDDPMVERDARRTATDRNAYGDERISRANGPRPPRLVACGPILLGVAVRSFARNMLVGVNRIGDGLTKRGGELQVFEELQSLARASVACRRVHEDASELVIAYTEQGIAARPERHVRAAGMRCTR